MDYEIFFFYSENSFATGATGSRLDISVGEKL